MQAGSSLAYLEDYLDTFEALPLELTRQLTQLKELDAGSFQPMEQAAKDAPEFLAKYESLELEARESEAKRLNDLFTQLITHGKEKVKMATQIYDLVERHIRRLDDDLIKFEEEQMTGPRFMPGKHEYKHVAEKSQGRPRRPDTTPKSATIINLERKNEDIFGEVDEYKDASPMKGTPTSSSGRTRRANQIKPPPIRREIQPPPPPSDIQDDSVEPDPEPEVDDADADGDGNEPTYCICDRVSFGEMIACDNDDCAREWFHVTCVGLSGPVKGKWFCPDCEELMKVSSK